METSEYTKVIEENLGDFSGIRAMVSGGSLYVYIDDTSKKRQDGLYPVLGMEIKKPTFTKQGAKYLSTMCRNAFLRKLGTGKVYDKNGVVIDPHCDKCGVKIGGKVYHSLDFFTTGDVKHESHHIFCSEEHINEWSKAHPV